MLWCLAITLSSAFIHFYKKKYNDTVVADFVAAVGCYHSRLLMLLLTTTTTK